MAKKRKKIPSRPSGKKGSRKGFPKSNQDLMRQVNQLQEQMEKAQAELEEREFEASAGGGVVTATVNGAKRLISMSIDPDAVDEDDVEMLEDLVIAAVNEALASVDEAQLAQNNNLADGLGINIPDIF